MKYIYITYIRIILILILVMNLGSCSEDFLEVEPRGVLVASETNDYDLMLNSNDLWLNGESANPLIIRSFESCGLEPYFSNLGEDTPNRRHFNWEPNAFNPNEEVSYFLVYMKRIYIYNKVINEVLSSTGGSDNEKNRIRAEAMAARAAVYFELINLYGQPYDTSTAGSNLGVPIVIEADVTANNFVRATVQEVYDFIIEDLTTAIPLLPTKVDQRPRMSKGAAEALLGKVYVNANRYDEAISLFNNAIASFDSDANINLYDYNETTLPGGIHAAGFLGPPIIMPVGNEEIAFNMSAFNPLGFSLSDILLSPEISALYGPSDIRLNHFFSRKPFPSFPWTPDFTLPGVYRKTGTLITDRGIRVPTVYLLRAECKARTNDLTGAIADLEFLRSHRMVPADAPVPEGLSQDDLIKFVINERTREFALDGELWYDMRRLWNDPLFQYMKPYTHTLYNEDGTIKETYTLTKERLVLRFSDITMGDNPSLVNNP